MFPNPKFDAQKSCLCQEFLGVNVQIALNKSLRLPRIVHTATESIRVHWHITLGAHQNCQSPHTFVARFTSVAKICQTILNPCSVWKAHYHGKKPLKFPCPNKCVRKHKKKYHLQTSFSEQKMFVSPSQTNQIASDPLLKNNFFTNFQGTGPREGPVHLSRFVLRVHVQKTFAELILEP